MMRSRAALEQQLAGPLGLVVLHAGGAVGRDVHVEDVELVAPGPRVAFVQAAGALAQALHLGALEHEAGFVAVFDDEVVPRAPVLRDDLDACFLPGHDAAF